LIDNHIHIMGHGEHSYTAEWISRYLSQARTLSLSEIGFSDHDWFYQEIDLSLARSVQERCFQELNLRMGMEVDYFPEREQEIAEMIRNKPFDFVIGSVHHIGDWPFDHPDHKKCFEEQDIDMIYEKYYVLVKKLINSGLFDVLGHLDLIKIWGHRPVRRSQTDYLQSILDDLKRSGMVVEINSAGLRKPVGEMYPSRDLLEELFRAGIPITFGSDAHSPEDLGAGLSQAAHTAMEIGFRSMIGFQQRRKIPAHIAAG
jgi:histidinol-phosphatase (PHP family)